jgi:hypothetical protein
MQPRSGRPFMALPGQRTAAFAWSVSPKHFSASSQSGRHALAERASFTSRPDGKPSGKTCYHVLDALLCD